MVSAKAERCQTRSLFWEELDAGEETSVRDRFDPSFIDNMPLFVQVTGSASTYQGARGTRHVTREPPSRSWAHRTRTGCLGKGGME